MPARPRHPQARRRPPRPPDHPRTVQAPELLLDQIVGAFFADRIFGLWCAVFLAAQLPATDAISFHTPLAVVAAMLTAALLFNLPRRRLQRAVNRRFHRLA
jgi:hypothetical protein